MILSDPMKCCTFMIYQHNLYLKYRYIGILCHIAIKFPIFGEVSDRQVGYKNQIWDLMHHVTTPIFDCTLRKFINGLLNIWKLVRITRIVDPQSIHISVRELFLN